MESSSQCPETPKSEVPSAEPSLQSKSLKKKRKLSKEEIRQLLTPATLAEQIIKRFGLGRARPKDSSPRQVEKYLSAKISHRVGEMTLEEKEAFLRYLEKRVKGGSKPLYKWASRWTKEFGQIRVKRTGALVVNKASKYADRLLGGDKGKIIEFLEVVKELAPKHVQEVLRIAKKAPPNRKLSTIIAEAESDVGSVAKWCAEGAKFVGSTESIIELARSQGTVIKNIVRVATSGMGFCRNCAGLGKTKHAPTDLTETVDCLICEGSGREKEHPKMLQAAELVAKVTKMMPGNEGQVQILNQTNNATLIQGERGRFSIEKRAELMDKLLNKRTEPALLPEPSTPKDGLLGDVMEVMEAELVPIGDEEN